MVKNQLLSLWQAEGLVFTARQSTFAFKALAVALTAAALAGCANADGTNGDPGPTVLGAGETCQSIRANLISLDKKGVQGIVERQNAGKKLSAQEKAQADLYNRLLNQYLGARCHV